MQEGPHICLWKEYLCYADSTWRTTGLQNVVLAEIHEMSGNIYMCTIYICIYSYRKNNNWDLVLEVKEE